MHIRRPLFALLLACALTASAQIQTPLPVTAILTTLTIKKDVDRVEVKKILPTEVRATVKLYLAGKIQQWWARTDGTGVVFIMNCSNVDEAKELMNTLPLAKANLADFEYTALGPLNHLRLLVE
jgi:hypothetical protein